MIIYLDTGFFVDYFSRRSMIAVKLRTESRRGRSIQKIQEDSNAVMKKLNSHKAITSVLTILEYKENTFNELKKFSRGLDDITIENIMKNKTEASTVYERCQRNNIQLISLNDQILKEALTNPEYNELRINDAIHIQTARAYKAKVIVSTDSRLLKFDGVFDNIRIVDTDEALKFL